MKIAATICDILPFVPSPADAVRLFEGSGFRYLDYSFYHVLNQPQHPFLSDFWQKDIEKAGEEAARLGFSFVQAHAPACSIRPEKAEPELTATLRSIEACGMLGIENMVIHTGFFREIPYRGGNQAYFEANRPFFEALIPAMEKHGVHILFENTTRRHCPDDCYFPTTAQDLNEWIDFLHHPLFGAAWDVGHAHMDSIDHEAEICALGPNLRAIHVHDNDASRDQHMAPFCGSMDFDSLMRGLISSGYSGFFTLETDGFLPLRRNRNLNGPLAHTPLSVKKQSLALLYTISREILSAYDVYEE